MKTNKNFLFLLDINNSTQKCFIITQCHMLKYRGTRQYDFFFRNNFLDKNIY